MVSVESNEREDKNMHEYQGCGGAAPELAQARLRQELAAKKKRDAEAPPPPPKPEQTPAVENIPADAEPKTSPEIDAKVQSLEMLPDQDLRDIASKHLRRVDKRWGRDRLIEELLKLGVDGAAVAHTPAPPKVVGGK